MLSLHGYWYLAIVLLPFCGDASLKSFVAIILILIITISVVLHTCLHIGIVIDDVA